MSSASPNNLRRLVPKHEARTPSESPTDDGSTASKRRRCVSSACMQCRKRKSKCDGEKPFCESCSIVYNTPCTYDIDSDHRRKGALKRDIRHLEAENEKRDIILDAIRKGSEADVDDIIQLVRSDEPYDTIIENIKRMLVKPAPRIEGATTLEGEFAASSSKPPRSKAGETRHYGHTSNLALVVSDDEQPSMPINQIGTWTKVTSDAELVEHLLSLYFAWSHPFYVLFSEEVFYHGLKTKQLKYCSPLLVNAVLAVACNYSDRPEARADRNDPTTVGKHFFDEAKRLLAEDDRSCLTTVQALGVMSCRQAMNNKDSAGWKYAGQMITMAIELGLHLADNAQSDARAASSEIEARRITFWGSYSVETLWAICVGRISALPRTAIKLEKPSPRDDMEKKTWKPHGDPRYTHEVPSLEQPSVTYSLLVQLGSLSEIVNDIVQMFYAPRDRITSRKLQSHHEKFQQWYSHLPPPLHLKQEGPTLPQVIALHIYYHNCIIHLFRPFLRVSFVQNTKAPRAICTEAAVTISHLMALYSSTYGMRRAYFVIVHSAMSAAIIHLVNISSQNSLPTTALEAAHLLSDKIRMLHEMHTTYPIMAQYFKVIRGLISKWVPVVPPNVRDALQAIDLPSPISSGSASTSDPSSHTPFSTLSGDPTPRSHQTNETQKPSMAPDLTQMAPHLHSGESTMSREFLWTPFPESMDGMPVMPPERQTGNQNMDISRMLDSGVDGDWAQLNRDGFTMDARRDFWGV